MQKQIDNESKETEILRTREMLEIKTTVKRDKNINNSWIQGGG